MGSRGAVQVDHAGYWNARVIRRERDGDLLVGGYNGSRIEIRYYHPAQG